MTMIDSNSHHTIKPERIKSVPRAWGGGGFGIGRSGGKGGDGGGGGGSKAKPQIGGKGPRKGPVKSIKGAGQIRKPKIIRTS